MTDIIIQLEHILHEVEARNALLAAAHIASALDALRQDSEGGDDSE